MADKQTLTPEESYNILVSQCHAPVFFEKLARVYNIKPNNQDEARDLLQMAGQLRSAHEQERGKEASATTNFYANAKRDLANTLNTQGYKSAVDDDFQVKQAATEAAKNPLLCEAALTFASYLQSQLNK